MRQRDIKEFFKNMLNYVEDRRIDHYVVSSSITIQRLLFIYVSWCGFNSPTIDKGLKSDETQKLLDSSYMFRIINLTNPNTNLDLPGLRDILNTIDLRNISRLQSTSRFLLKVSYKAGVKIVLQIPDDTDRDETYNDIKKIKSSQQSMNQQGGGRTGGSEGHDMVNDYSVNRIKEMIKKYQDSNDYERLLDQVQVELEDIYKMVVELHG